MARGREAGTRKARAAPAARAGPSGCAGHGAVAPDRRNFACGNTFVHGAPLGLPVAPAVLSKIGPVSAPPGVRNVWLWPAGRGRREGTRRREGAGSSEQPRAMRDCSARQRVNDGCPTASSGELAACPRRATGARPAGVGPSPRDIIGTKEHAWLHKQRLTADDHVEVRHGRGRVKV